MLRFKKLFVLLALSGALAGCATGNKDDDEFFRRGWLLPTRDAPGESRNAPTRSMGDASLAPH